MLALSHGLLPEPAHVLEQDLLVVRAFVEIGDPAMLQEGINRSPILADALGINTSGFAVGKIFFSGSCQRDPACAVGKTTALCAEAFPLSRLNSSSASRCLRVRCRCASCASVPASSHWPLWLM
jgi:hypothetical protein